MLLLECSQCLKYLTRDIYVRHKFMFDINSGDLNDLGTKIWGFFLETAKFRKVYSRNKEYLPSHAESDIP